MTTAARPGLLKRVTAALTAVALIASSTAPATAQSFAGILGSSKAGAEARDRRMTAAKLADARAARALFAMLEAARPLVAAMPAAPSAEVYDPRKTRRAAELRVELANALDAYITVSSKGEASDTAAMVRLRDAVAPFAAFLDALAQRQGAPPIRTLTVGPGQTRSFDLSAYCMDSGLPAPGPNETFRLQPAAQLLPPELRPLVADMMTRPRSHAHDTQGLVWALRNAHKNRAPVSLSPEAAARLEATYPGAAQAIAAYNRRASGAKAIRGLIDAALPGARALVSQAEGLDPRRMIEDTRLQLAALERMPVAGAIDADAAYTTIAPGVAARTTSPWGGASRAKIEIANTSPQPYTFVPAEWVATSPRSTQHLALQLPDGFASGPPSDTALPLSLASLLSFGLDMSVLGNIKAALQLISGTDLLTGEKTSRWIELAGLIPIIGQEAKAGRALARAARRSEARVANTAAATSAREALQIAGGKPGAWPAELKPRNIRANTDYIVNGYRYSTDASARVVSASGRIDLQVAARNGYRQRAAGGADRLPSDQGGHLFASIFNGPGDAINLVPMDASLNLGAWKAMENTLAAAAREGRDVTARIDLTYPPGSVRPSHIEVTYTIDGRSISREFKNGA